MLSVMVHGLLLIILVHKVWNSVNSLLRLILGTFAIKMLRKDL